MGKNDDIQKHEKCIQKNGISKYKLKRNARD